MLSASRLVLLSLGLALAASLASACAARDAAPPADGRSGVTLPPGPSGDAFNDYAAENGLDPYAGDVRQSSPYGPPQPGSDAPPPSDLVADGLEPGESIVTVNDASGVHAAFKTPPQSDYCNPGPQTAYRVAKAADGSVVVTRLVPHVTIKNVHQPGSCGVGCGPPPPPPVSRVFVLPATTHVRVVTVPWEAEHTVITCDNPVPMP